MRAPRNIDIASVILRSNQTQWSWFEEYDASDPLPEKERGVPVFMIERRYAEVVNPDAQGAAEINVINAEEDVRWLYSFLSADRRRSYCMYEAESVDAIRRASVRAGLPADVIVEVSNRVLPDGSLHPVGE